MTAPLRRQPFFNAAPDRCPATPGSAEMAALVDNFHSQLPAAGKTRLVELPDIASELGVGAVYLKDESSRLGLPSFKILGASWGAFRAVAHKLGLPPYTEVATLKRTLKSSSVTLYAATEGNHGRAVARTGSILGTSVEIYVPKGMHEATIKLIESEGASVHKSEGSYDEAVLAAQTASRQAGGILVQDYAFGDYVDIPQWIVDGYTAMLREVDQQLGDTSPDLIISPVGCGCFAHAVVSHYKQEGKETAVLTVEPDTAACLWKSLINGTNGLIETTHTTMAGLDCGQVSSIAWPLFKSSLDASVTISDFEAHQASLDLEKRGVSAGPCGASPLAALRRLTTDDKARLGLNKDSVVVLLCTEGARDHEHPLDVSVNDTTSLTQTLVQINSANPSMGTVPGPGETAIAQYIAAWLEYRDIETHWIEPTKGRPSVVGVVRGTGGGKSLMFNGHIDTVTNVGYDGNPLSGNIKDGRLYGRGAADMKCGIAAALIALAECKTKGLRGDVIFTGVADEEATSIGTEDVLKAGWRADAALVNEPTDMNIINAHGGFIWFEIKVYGVAAHGSHADAGVDAITKAGYFLVALDQLAQQMKQAPYDAGLGRSSIHASLITGGEEASSYPASCTITVERRTITGETTEQATRELQTLLSKVSQDVLDFKADLQVTFERPPFLLPRDHPLSTLVSDVFADTVGGGRTATFQAVPFWTDCALLAEVGIPGLLLGPVGGGLHAKEEWVDLQSTEQVAKILTGVAERFCQ